MLEFELRIFDVGSNCSTNWAITTAHQSQFVMMSYDTKKVMKARSVFEKYLFVAPENCFSFELNVAVSVKVYLDQSWKMRSGDRREKTTKTSVMKN